MALGDNRAIVAHSGLFLCRARRGARLRCQRFRGEAWSAPGLAVTGVAPAVGRGCPWGGGSGGGEGAGGLAYGCTWAAEKCCQKLWGVGAGAAAAWEVLRERGCPQSRVPKAVSRPRRGWRAAQDPAPLFLFTSWQRVRDVCASPPLSIAHPCAPSQPSLVQGGARGVPHMCEGSPDPTPGPRP